MAIVIPLRSRINPISANLTASVRNIASGIDSKLTKTYSGKTNLRIRTRTKNQMVIQNIFES